MQDWGDGSSDVLDEDENRKKLCNGSKGLRIANSDSVDLSSLIFDEDLLDHSI